MFFKNRNKKDKVKVLDRGKRSWRGKKTSASSFSFGRFIFYLLGLVFLGTVVYFLFFSPYLLINSIEVSGAGKVDPEKIKNAMEERISGKFLEVIPKNNLLAINKNVTKKYLLDKFNRLESVEIKKIFPEKIIISVKEKEFKLIFSTGENKYLIDENGSAWSRNDFELESSEEENFITLTDESGKAISDVKAALNTDFIQYISDIREKVQNEAGLEISGNFYSPRLISGDLNVETREGWKIYFNREISIAKSIGILKSVLNDRIKKEDIPKLEYLDLRINNKVYYKLKTKENVDDAGKKPEEKQDTVPKNN